MGDMVTVTLSTTGEATAGQCPDAPSSGPSRLLSLDDDDTTLEDADLDLSLVERVLQASADNQLHVGYTLTLPEAQAATVRSTLIGLTGEAVKTGVETMITALADTHSSLA